MSYGYVHSRASAAPLALIGFDPAAYTVGDTDGEAVLVVKRTGSTVGACSASFATADGTAFAGLDYEAASGTVSWADGDGADKTISVVVHPSAPDLLWDASYIYGDVALSPNLKTATAQTTSGGVLSLDIESAPSGKVYVEMPYSGGTPLGGGQFCYFALVQFSSGAYIELHAQFDPLSGDPNNNSVLTGSFGNVSTVAVPAEGIVGFLLDWDALEMRIHLNGSYLDPQTGFTNSDFAAVTGITITASPIRISVGITGGV